MKVYMINVVCGIKSTGRICTDLATVLMGMGNHVRIAYGRENVPEKYKKISYRIGSDIDVRIHAVKSMIFDSSGFESKKPTKALIEDIKAFDPDVIHLHNLHGYYINIELLFTYLKSCGKKVIWTLHDCWAFTGHCTHFSMVSCEQWKSHCSYCKQKHEYPKCIMFSNVARNFQKKKVLFCGVSDLTLVAPSNWLADQVRESFFKEFPIVVIPNGIDLNAFNIIQGTFRKRYNLEGKKIILGVATAWGSRKGLDEFCELSKHLDDSYIIVLVGLDKKQMKNLPSEVVAIEKTDSIRELAEIYTAADVFLNLGREETMGLTTVEAMACGTPVVVSNLTAVPEVVDDKSGIILSDLSIESIEVGIKKVLARKYPNTREIAMRYEKKIAYLKYVELYKKGL